MKLILQKNLYTGFTLIIATLCMLPTPAQAYYGEAPTFHPQPNPGHKKPWNVQNLGPVGIGIDLKNPAFVMEVTNVEKGSPADKTGKFKKGQIIESINGQILKERDPRIILGDIITEAEATNGQLRFKIKGQGEVTVSIPVMGRYSETWPMNCPKSDKIVRGMADALAKLEKPSMGGVIFLLSTGEEKDLAVVRRWMKNMKDVGTINWHRGFIGMGVCEYYLRTGDASVLPAIRQGVKELETYMFNGSWSGRGGPASFTYSTGSGALHAAGVHCMTFLLLAKTCGVEVDEHTLQATLKQFYRFAGHGNVAYGDGEPEGGYTDNGKHSGLALAMAAATRLTPNGEATVYAKARDNSAMKAFYATNWFHAAHTGGGLGEIWHHWAMGLMPEKRPAQYRSYLDTRRWVMDLSRRYDGSIGIAGMTDRYDASATDGSKDGIDYGTFFALTYTLPRKHLHLFGAPLSKFAKSHPLPERPWGNPADDIFLSNDPVEHPSMTVETLMNEKVLTDSSFFMFSRVNNPGVSDDELIKYFHHPEIGLRIGAMRAAVNHGRYQFVVPLLKSQDARLRHIGLLAITGMFKGKSIPDTELTEEMISLVERIIENPDESWWVAKDAIYALARADTQTIAKHKELLFDRLENRDDTWTKVAAISTLSKICAQPDHYKSVLPRLLVASTKVWNNQASYVSTKEIRKQLASASPEVKEFAAPLVRNAYLAIPEKLQVPSGAVIGGGSENMKVRISQIMHSLPGGGAFIRHLPKQTLAATHSGRKEDMFVYKKFQPDPRFVGKWQYVGKAYGANPDDKSIEYTTRKTLQRIESSKHKKGRSKGRPSYLILQADGSLPRDGNRFWTGDLLIYNDVSEARRMKLRTVNGKEYLAVENGKFPEKAPKDWHPGYAFYLKQP